ncbi:hypothetical protein ACIP98_32625 [Streptomyces sp. NPDC088354]|uniref:hypothetical protein n=1 Tax=unclassified Streptomyces TaxID=2593676 RepID=UPI0029B6AD3F|nr:hypothetical protein [Streptomyces sp. MI02-7b]MDX3077004.1 hypothetical protein [Streptomyces sp. MI02-7b]
MIQPPLGVGPRPLTSQGLTRRPIVPTDAAALAGLLHAIEAVDTLGEYYSEEDAPTRSTPL